ncbi:MAG: OadG family protein [Spirochaetota bacterium]
MKKLKILPFILIIISVLFVFSSCANEKNATKYTQDIVILKDGSQIKGLIPPQQNLPYLQVITEDGTSKYIDKQKIKEVKNTDKIYLKDGTLVIGSIEDMIKVKEDDKTVEKVKIILKDGSVKTIPSTQIQNIQKTGTKKPEQLNPIEQFNEMTGNMGPDNIISKREDGKVDNGWLYTLIGILSVFAALTLMLIAFLLMKFVKPEEKKKEEESFKEKTATKVAKGTEDGITPEIVTAISMAINLTEESKVILTIDRKKSKSSNWAYAGWVENSERSDF